MSIANLNIAAEEFDSAEPAQAVRPLVRRAGSPSDQFFALGFNRRAAGARFEEIKSAQVARLGHKPDHRAAVKRIAGCERGLVLATCCRVEIHGLLEEGASAEEMAASFLDMLGLGREFAPLLEWRQGADAFEHLIWISLGGDSILPGETEILNQLKTAYREACAADALLGAPLLHHAYQRAFFHSKKLRGLFLASEAKTRSLPRIAADEAARLLGLEGEEAWEEGPRVAIAGAGEMALGLRRSLVRLGLPAERLTFFVRDPEKTRQRGEFPARANVRPLGEMAQALRSGGFDALFGALGGGDPLAAGPDAWLPEGKRLVLIDLGAPPIADEPTLRAVPAERLAFLGLADIAERRRAQCSQTRRALDEALATVRSKARGMAQAHDKRVHAAFQPLRDELLGELKLAAERDAEQLAGCLSHSFPPAERERLRAALQQMGRHMAGHMAHRAVEAVKGSSDAAEAACPANRPSRN